MAKKKIFVELQLPQCWVTMTKLFFFPFSCNSAVLSPRVGWSTMTDHCPLGRLQPAGMGPGRQCWWWWTLGHPLPSLGCLVRPVPPTKEWGRSSGGALWLCLVPIRAATSSVLLAAVPGECESPETVKRRWMRNSPYLRPAFSGKWIPRTKSIWCV